MMSLANASHRPYFRGPASWSLPPPPEPPRIGARSKAAKRRRPRQTHSVPLIVISELLGCSASRPYAAVRIFGLPLWARARLRERLTQGANYAFGAQLERSIRFNAFEMERHAKFVLALRGDHQGRRIDGVALAGALGLAPHPDALAVWLSLVTRLAEELLDAVEYGHLEDLPWAKAERFLDIAVVPRVRKLASTDLSAEPPLPNVFGGYKRVKRVREGLASKDPDVVKRTLKGSDFARLRFKEIPDLWESWPDGAVDDHAASKSV